MRGQVRAGGNRRDAILRRYDRPLHEDPLVVDYYGASDFFNFGYWTPGTATQRDACENLMEKLLAFLPEKTGAILDVACGLGATTRHLLRYYPPGRVTAVNISLKQLERSRANAPGCRVALMNAAELAFGDRTFDAAICVEAAFHFETRARFLQEAYRVLRPGGWLVLSDILVVRLAARLNQHIGLHNHVEGLAEYRRLYAAAGFQDIGVVDATRECWTGFYTHLWRWRRERFRAGRIPRLAYYRMCLRNLVANAGLTHYLLVAARKPLA